jgi:hypothetical protein
MIGFKNLPLQPTNIQLYGNSNKGKLEYGIRNALSYEIKYQGFPVEIKNNIDYNVE